MAQRFMVDVRGGIIAVRDRNILTNMPGLHADYDCVVASWHGRYDKEKGYWTLEKWQVEKANYLCKLLNERNSNA
jgi:hypothetical protein